MLTLYGTSKTRAFRCLWLLEECGASFQHVPLNPKKGEQYQEPYKSILLSRKVPYLEDADVKIFESAAICIYLSRRFERSDLWPTSPTQEAYAMQWLSYLLQEIDPQLYMATLHSKLLPEDQRVKAVVDYALASLKRPLQVLSKHIQESRNDASGFMLQEFSLVDIFTSQCISWLQWIAPEICDQSLLDYNKPLIQRAAYQKAKTYA